MRQRVTMLGVGVCLALGATASAAGPALPAGAPAASLPAPRLDLKNPSAVAAMIAQLGDPDYAVRQDGQKLLETVPYEQCETLRDIAARVDDPEAKARLLAQVEKLEVDRALRPPPLSIEVKDASIEEVVLALSAATGTTMAPPSLPVARAGQPPIRYTLSAKEKPFWEIMRDLNAQHPLWPITSATSDFLSMRLASRGAAWQEMQITGGVCISATGPVKPLPPGAVAAVGAGGAVAVVNATQSIAFGVTLDPRIVVSQIRAPVMLKITDLDGKVLNAGPSPVVGLAAASSLYVESRYWSRSISWTQPREDALALTGAALSGEIPIVLGIPVSGGAVTFDDFAPQAADVGEYTFTLVKFLDNPQTRELALSIRLAPLGTVSPQPVSAVYRMPLVPQLEIVDSKGRRAALLFPRDTGPAAFVRSLTIPLDPALQRPLKLVVTPLKPKEITIPFDFRRLPVH